MIGIFSDWKFWLFFVSIIKDVILVLGIILVKFNDLKHLDKDMQELKKQDKSTNKRMARMEKSIVVIETILKERFKR